MGGGSCGGHLGEPLASWGGDGGMGVSRGAEKGQGLVGVGGNSAGAPMQGSSCRGLGCPNPVGPWVWKPRPHSTLDTQTRQCMGPPQPKQELEEGQLLASLLPHPWACLSRYQFRG